MAKLKKIFKNRWALTTAIVLTAITAWGGFAFAGAFGQAAAVDLAKLIPIAIPGLAITFVHGLVLGLGLEQVFKK